VSDSKDLHVDGAARLDGLVGIGTASPATDLHVNGDATFVGTSEVTGTSRVDGAFEVEGTADVTGQLTAHSASSRPRS